MMNKSAIATILGTTILGLIRKNSGGFNNSDNSDLECISYEYNPKSLENMFSLSGKERSMVSDLNLGWKNIHSLPNDFFDKLAEFHYLQKLSLFKNELSELPYGIDKLKNLKALNLNINNFDSIPSEIFNLRGLSDLGLRGNNLTSLPPEIGNLTNLKGLDLSGNNLTSLPPEIGNLVNLKTLVIDGNKNLVSLPPEIGNLVNLKEIYFRAAEMGVRGGRYETKIISLPKEFGNLKTNIIIDEKTKIQTPSPTTLQFWMKNLHPSMFEKIVRNLEKPSSQLRKF